MCEFFKCTDDIADAILDVCTSSRKKWGERVSSDDPPTGHSARHRDSAVRPQQRVVPVVVAGRTGASAEECLPANWTFGVAARLPELLRDLPPEFRPGRCPAARGWASGVAGPLSGRGAAGGKTPATRGGPCRLASRRGRAGAARVKMSSHRTGSIVAFWPCARLMTPVTSKHRVALASLVTMPPAVACRRRLWRVSSRLAGRVTETAGGRSTGVRVRAAVRLRTNWAVCGVPKYSRRSWACAVLGLACPQSAGDPQHHVCWRVQRQL